MAHFLVRIDYRDDSHEYYECCDTPTVSDWITLFPRHDATARRMLPSEGVKEISWSFKSK